MLHVPAAGTLLDGCLRLTRSLGEGAVGRTYEGENTLQHLPVAIKVFSPRSYAPSMFAQYAEVLTELATHALPGVPRLIAISPRTADPCYVVTELLAGESLAARLNREQRLPWPVALAICAECATILAQVYATTGYNHLNLKAANVLLDAGASGTTVHLLDYGLHHLETETEQTGLRTRALLTPWTCAYRAPEQILCEPCDFRTDVYALGVLLFQAIAGRLPFTGTQTEMANRHMHQPPPHLQTLIPDLPVDVGALVMRALAKSPNDRFAHPSALVDEIRRIQPQSVVPREDPPTEQYSRVASSGLRSPEPTVEGRKQPRPAPTFEAQQQPNPEHTLEAPKQPRPAPTFEAQQRSRPALTFEAQQRSRPVPTFEAQQLRPEHTLEAPNQPRPEHTLETPNQPRPEHTLEAPKQSQPEHTLEAPKRPTAPKIPLIDATIPLQRIPGPPPITAPDPPNKLDIEPTRPLRRPSPLDPALKPAVKPSPRPMIVEPTIEITRPPPRPRRSLTKIVLISLNAVGIVILLIVAYHTLCTSAP